MSNKTSTAIATVQSRPSLIHKVAAKYSVDPDKMLSTLKATAFKSEKEVSNEQMMALLIVADQYNLNPWTKEIYAYPDKYKGITAVVGVDGWIRMINDHPQFESMELEIAPHEADEIPEWFQCTIQRKDRTKPTVVREYFAECKRNSEPWNTMPRRMLRHKAIIQCGRVAFGFSGIHDPDEADRIREIDVTPNAGTAGKPATQRPKALNGPPALANEEQLELVREALAKSEVTDEALFTRFKIVAIEELQFEQVAEALTWINGNRAS